MVTVRDIQLLIRHRFRDRLNLFRRANPPQPVNDLILSRRGQRLFPRHHLDHIAHSIGLLIQTEHGARRDRSRAQELEPVLLWSAEGALVREHHARLPWFEANAREQRCTGIGVPANRELLPMHVVRRIVLGQQDRITHPGREELCRVLVGVKAIHGDRQLDMNRTVWTPLAVRLLLRRIDHIVRRSDHRGHIGHAVRVVQERLNRPEFSHEVPR